MAAPLGNQFWKLKAKHGRDKLFASAKLLWDAACEYFQWCDENPWLEKDWVGKDAVEVEREKKVPYTLTGFCVYVGASEAWWRNFRSGSNLDDEFLSVITRIEEIIRHQKFVGAANGAFNANIISRDLGLADKQESKNETNHTGAVTVTTITSGVPLAGRESEIDTNR